MVAPVVGQGECVGGVRIFNTLEEFADTAEGAVALLLIGAHFCLASITQRRPSGWRASRSIPRSRPIATLTSNPWAISQCLTDSLTSSSDRNRPAGAEAGWGRAGGALVGPGRTSSLTIFP